MNPNLLSIESAWDRQRGRIVILCALIMLGVLLFGAYLFGARSSAAPREVIAPAAAQSQPDGSVIAERRPQASPGKAPHTIPKGATEERRASIKLKPSAPPVADASGVLESAPVTVNLSLIRQDDGRRVIASSPDGQILGAVDIPIEAGLMPISRPWAAGASCDPGNCRQTVGVWVDRDLGRVRLGAELARLPAGEVQGRVKAGWVW